MNPTKLMEELNSTQNLEYFENETIQSIINFKWKKYTIAHFKFNFYIYLIFILSFCFDVLYSVYWGKT